MNFNTETLAAFLKTLCVLIVNGAMLFGVSLDHGIVADLICAAVMLVVTLGGCYFNMNFTEAAQFAQRILDAVKAGHEVSVVYADLDPVVTGAHVRRADGGHDE